jgi:hypothetical protein
VGERPVATDWTIDELKSWDQRIREAAEGLGLTLHPQEFEICDREQMLGFMSYTGMPAHYPHWSFGKRFEKLKTLHEHGVTGLPYEMVINSRPVLAYLMRDNTLCQQILTIAHVYGHNDFFLNNHHFGETRPELTVGRFKLRAERVRGYVEDPSIGLRRVEEVLDAAHALSLHLRRHPGIRKLTREEQEERAVERARPRRDPHADIRTRDEAEEPDLTRLPLEPEEDILLFIRDHNPYLGEWEKDLLETDKPAEAKAQRDLLDLFWGVEVVAVHRRQPCRRTHQDKPPWVAVGVDHPQPHRLARDRRALHQPVLGVQRAHAVEGVHGQSEIQPGLVLRTAGTHDQRAVQAAAHPDVRRLVGVVPEGAHLVGAEAIGELLTG